MTDRQGEVIVLLGPEWARQALVHDVQVGLGSVPRSLPPQWLYDDRGSELFDQITRVPEYYPTEREREILRARADEIVTASGADVVIELGSGTSDKTRTLLDAFTARDHLRRFVPLDVSEGTVRAAADELAQRYPATEVVAVVGDFNRHLGDLPRDGRRLLVFLGGTIGNYSPEHRAQFLAAVASALNPGDHFLLGADVVKSADRLIAAYDDPQGITELFIRNALDVMNRELGADFDQDAFEYVCFWDPTRERIDMRLRSLRDQHVSVPQANVEVDLARDEEICIETSAKFRSDSLAGELAAVGLPVSHTWTDAAGDFLLLLARRD